MYNNVVQKMSYTYFMLPQSGAFLLAAALSNHTMTDFESMCSETILILRLEGKLYTASANKCPCTG